MKIVAIGGGERWEKHTMPDGTIKYIPTNAFLDNTPINKKLFELSGKDNPTLLFLGTASNDLPEYATDLISHFKSLGANASELRLINNPPTIKQMRKIMDDTDIIYVGGGDPVRLMKCWAKTGFDKLLKEYADKDIVFSGISAGAMCWFDYYDNETDITDKNGHADWNKLDLLPGLGFLNGFCLPHYNTIPDANRNHFGKLPAKYGTIGYAIDDNAAIIFDNGKISTFSCKPDRGIHYLTV